MADLDESLHSEYPRQSKTILQLRTVYRRRGGEAQRRRTAAVEAQSAAVLSCGETAAQADPLAAAWGGELPAFPWYINLFVQFFVWTGFQAAMLRGLSIGIKGPGGNGSPFSTAKGTKNTGSRLLTACICWKMCWQTAILRPLNS